MRRAYDGAEGLLEAVQFAPHVAILDNKLPKSTPSNARVPLAKGARRQAHADPRGADYATLQRAIDAGFDRVLRKPMKIALLIDAVRTDAGSRESDARRHDQR